MDSIAEDIGPPADISSLEQESQRDADGDVLMASKGSLDGQINFSTTMLIRE